MEHLATQLETLRAEVNRDDTITVAAGDLIGASPLLSAAFHDEPTIESLGLAGLDYASVGNHEFDEGADELLRIQEGGCHPDRRVRRPGHARTRGQDSRYCPRTPSSPRPTRRCCLPYAIHEVGGVKVGFIGMTLEGTPDM